MLQELRKNKGLSQSELSRVSGVSLSTIQKYERGAKDIQKASGDILYRLSEALGCKMEDFIKENKQGSVL